MTTWLWGLWRAWRRRWKIVERDDGRFDIYTRMFPWSPFWFLYSGGWDGGKDTLKEARDYAISITGTGKEVDWHGKEKM